MKHLKIKTIFRLWKIIRAESQRIINSQQNTKDMDGYYFEGSDCSQMEFWTCYSDRASKEHQHDFDEYMVCVYGQYTVRIDRKEIVLNPGDEFFIPKGTVQSGRCIAGTRTIHAFGGKRIHNV